MHASWPAEWLAAIFGIVDELVLDQISQCIRVDSMVAVEGLM